MHVIWKSITYQSNHLLCLLKLNSKEVELLVINVMSEERQRVGVGDGPWVSGLSELVVGVWWVRSKVAFYYLLIKTVNRTIGLTGRIERDLQGVGLRISGLNEANYLEVIHVWGVEVEVTNVRQRGILCRSRRSLTRREPSPFEGKVKMKRAGKNKRQPKGKKKSKAS